MIVGFLISIILIVAINVTAAEQNYGMEGDEVFSYLSSNSMGGFKGICFLEDQTWYDATYFENALTATGSERFNVGMVFDNQAMDTHPPLYYVFLNLICSSFEGQFSRWFGIGLNIFFMLLVNLCLYLLLQFFLKKPYLSLTLSTVFCCSFLAVNMVLFIRMYVLLMALVLLQTWFHLRLYKRLSENEEFVAKQYCKEGVLLLLITLAGALTHYYFLIYQCLISFILVVALWRKKKFKVTWYYIGTMVVSAILYIAIYPAALTYLFFKYRGRDAVHKFLKETSLLGEVDSMLRQYNNQMFKGWLIYLVLILMIATVILLACKKIQKKTVFKGCIFLFPLAVYFYGITKASPYVIIRYISPIATLLYALLVVSLIYLLNHATDNKKLQTAGQIVLCLVFFLTSFYFFDNSLKPSYFSERKEIVDSLAKEAEYCVYVTGDEYNWKMWEDYVNYPEFKGLFFIDGQKKQPITDEKMTALQDAVIYIDTALDYEETKQYLQEYLSFEEYEVMYQTSYTYIVQCKGIAD